MEVSRTVETKEYVVFETNTHYWRTTEDKINQLTDKPDGFKTAYRELTKGLKKLRNIDVDSGFQRDQSRDLIFKEAFGRNPPYRLDGVQMVLSEYEKKDAPNIEASKQSADDEVEA